MSAAITGEEFRRVLSHLPTGVAVITGDGPAGPTGLAANSVTSVSLDPPLILFCPARTSETWPSLRDSARFCINVMADSHAELTRRFARKGIDRFAGVDWAPRATGPGLVDAVAWVECNLREEHDAGDHTIVVADVLAIESATKQERLPLVFFRGRYGTFIAPEA
ncbi:MAG: flavin reductase family protein [Actinomycetota bacterium]|nr:flavin reductase family protein [Actinomycetota bacterium]